MTTTTNTTVTCGTCGRSWDDSIITSMTPAPSARCPFEGFHDGEPVPEDWPVQPLGKDGLRQNPDAMAHLRAGHSVSTQSLDWTRNFWHLDPSDPTVAEIYDSEFLTGGDDEEGECATCGAVLNAETFVA